MKLTWVIFSALVIAAMAPVLAVSDGPTNAMTFSPKIRFSALLLARSGLEPSSSMMTLMGLPPVLAGLFVYLLLTYRGVLGEYELLFTPAAMVMAQVLLASPIICGLTARAVLALNQDAYDTAVTLGASRRQAAASLMREARIGIVASLTTAFGRVIAEVGAVMLVGGNIRWSTRVLTTSIVLETRMGNFSTAIAIGIILLIISFVINMLIIALEKRAFRYDHTIQIT